MMRLTGGSFKGREIRTLPGEKTRPTGAKLRQALFNSIQFEIEGARCLDLFAGSGALGFEALSRGAESCVFVDQSIPAMKIIRDNAGKLGCRDQCRFIEESFDRCKAAVQPSAPFDFVFCDPPYAADFETRILADLPWADWLKPGGRLVLEWGKTKSKVDELPDRIGVLTKIREKIYGDTILTHYRFETEEPIHEQDDAQIDEQN